MCDESINPPASDSDGLGRAIVQIRDGAVEQLHVDIRRMIQLSRDEATRQGVPLRCRLTPPCMLVCEVKTNAMSGFDSWADSPCFFQNSCGVTFQPNGLPVGQEPVRLYYALFLPGQFRQFCEQILRDEGYLPSNR